SARVEVSGTFPLARGITGLVGWPAVLANDSDVAGLAEALFGAGKGFSPIFYITIGSGIGGGLIINGEIYRGCGRGAAEIGHLRALVVKGFSGLSLKHMPLEAIASGWGIENNFRWFFKQCLESPNPDLKRQRESLVLRLADGY